MSPILTATIYQVATYYLFPVILWIVLTRRLDARWRMIGLGSLTWLTALPLIIGVPLVASLLLGGDDPTRSAIVWGTALSLTAGIAEETSRYGYYRRSAVLRDPASLRPAIVAGAGHGGTEALVLGIQYALVPLALLLWFPQMLPPQMAGTPFAVANAVINGTSRMALVMCHIGFTLLVWRAVSQRRVAPYVVAVALHVLLDLAAFVLPIVVPGLAWLVWPLVLALLLWTIAQITPALRRPRVGRLAEQV